MSIIKHIEQSTCPCGAQISSEESRSYHHSSTREVRTFDCGLYLTWETGDASFKVLRECVADPTQEALRTRLNDLHGKIMSLICEASLDPHDVEQLRGDVDRMLRSRKRESIWRPGPRPVPKW